MTNQQRWDQYFIDIADVVRTKSKDPSTKVGAVIVGTEKQIVSTGFNGMPRSIAETDPSRWERPVKYQYLCHAERNAIDNAARTGVSLLGCTLYLAGFLFPCTECAKSIIQSGIGRVCTTNNQEIPEAWADDLDFSTVLLSEAGIVCDEL